MVAEKKLSVIGAWSDSDENLVQVIYEDIVSGSVYIERVQPKDRGVTKITTTGEVESVSLEDFEWLKE